MKRHIAYRYRAYPTPAQYKKDHVWLKEADSLALTNVQLQLKKAFQRFFLDEKTGYPNYKSKHRSKKSYTTNLMNRNKESSYLVNQYDYIGIEDLDMKGMSQALRFGKSVSDNGWGKFVAMLTYKAEMRGKHVIKADRMFPSCQMCHVCGFLNPETKDLKVRKWNCPVCGAQHNRDQNATENLKTEALRIALL